MGETIFIGGGGDDYGVHQELLLKYANRHGLIAGATGTGKTVTLQILAEGFAAQGVPVFHSDVKGDLSGLAKAGSEEFKLHEPFMSRAATIGFDDYTYDAFPVTFWDLYGQQGHPVRTTVSEMGPLLLARLLELTDVQEGILNIAFRVADEEGLPLLDLKDLQSMLVWLGENREAVSIRYGNVATSSVGAIQRQLLVLENQGATQFFGEPTLELSDIMRTDPDGRGRINILAADKLMSAPRLYATSLLWLLSELIEELPVVSGILERGVNRKVLYVALLLHDIGKLGITNAILDKKGGLTDAEREKIEEHPKLSEDILLRVRAFHPMAKVAVAHHERLDGRGYPYGIGADQLTLDMRILSVADVFDALSAERPYRGALPLCKTYAIMEQMCDTALDRSVVAQLKVAIEGAPALNFAQSA